MKTKAAVAVAARKPLEITTVDLDGPRNEFTRSGADPEGLFSVVDGVPTRGVAVYS